MLQYNTKYTNAVVKAYSQNASWVNSLPKPKNDPKYLVVESGIRNTGKETFWNPEPTEVES